MNLFKHFPSQIKKFGGLLLSTGLVLLGGILVVMVARNDTASKVLSSTDNATVTDVVATKLDSSERENTSAHLSGISKRSDQIANVSLVTHDGRTVLFRDDLVDGKKVVVNFMYTICNGICPGMTNNIKKARAELAAQGVDDITFISISIEPEQDTPAQLTKYMRNNKIENAPGMPPWIFLTGKLEDIDKLRRSLGVYDPDPAIDADRRQHGGTLTYGNDRSDWWGATPALQSPDLTVKTLLRNLSSDKRMRPGFTN